MAPVKKQKVVKVSSEDEEEKSGKEATATVDNDEPQEEDEDEDGDEEEEEEEGEEEEIPEFALRRCYYSDDSDCDPEDYNHPDYLHYIQQIRDSNGFYVPPRPKGLKVSYNEAECDDMATLEQLSKLAIEFYNNNNGSNYVYDSVVMGSISPAGGLVYYITFKAFTDAATEEELHLREFEAIVFEGISETIVNQCNLKHMPPPKSSAS